MLEGQFISDDSHYVQRNQYVHDITVSNVIDIWSPTSEVTVLVENYAPVHLMLHSFEWQVFGNDVTGYHVVNVLLHALAAAMLIPIFRRSGVGAWPAFLGAGLFLAHPANVESVAWISQLKSSSSLVLSLAAILLHPRRPLLAFLCFALGLFAKPFAAFALPVLVLFGWLRRPSADQQGEAPSFRWPWLGAWAAVLLLFGVIESFAFSQTAGLAPPLYADGVTRFLTIFAIALRYLLLALTGIGLSTFHEPPPVVSPLDPWFVLGVLAIGLLGWRCIAMLRRGREEAVYWLWAAISFAPLSGVLPLPYPMADRYLYFVLPGLIGGSLLLWQDSLLPRFERLRGESAGRALAAKVGLAVVAILFVQFARLTFDRAEVFVSSEALMSDAERNYPNGVAAHTRGAGRSAAEGDLAGAIAHLEAAWARGYNRVDHLITDPRYRVLDAEPRFVALKHAMADDWISRLDESQDLTHYKARALAQAYVAKDDLAGAARVIEKALARPGPIAEGLAADLAELRRRIEFEKRLEAVKRRAS